LTKVRAGLVTLHPTQAYRDSYPVKMFEYMAAGIPVIASNFLLWREIVDRNKCGICVDPLKPQEIAKAVQWIADHPEEAKLMGENGRKAVEEKYNWECENKKLLKVYKGILEEG
ncbi:glycosyltransferase, partial [Candidatus Pacearchaeota archaeon]|nr:glycosyltransferase [Candidatus Pacearchaeota archaeon]